MRANETMAIARLLGPTGCLTIAVSTALLLLPTTATASPAQLAGPDAAVSSLATVTCSGYGCDGTSPDATGCSASAETVSSLYLPNPPGYGTSTTYLELRYSVACRTTWARISNVPVDPDYPSQYAYVHRNSDGRKYTCYAGYGGNKTNTCYSKQVYDGGVTSYAYGFSEGPVTASGRTASY